MNAMPPMEVLGTLSVVLAAITYAWRAYNFRFEKTSQGGSLEWRRREQN